jgi:hypothetical protein
MSYDNIKNILCVGGALSHDKSGLFKLAFVTNEPVIVFTKLCFLLIRMIPKSYIVTLD